jgi:hypothetical protein
MIRWTRAVVPGLLGTVVFDRVGLLLTGTWSTPMTLDAKFKIGLAGGIVAHHVNRVLPAVVFARVGPSPWGPDWLRVTPAAVSGVVAP